MNYRLPAPEKQERQEIKKWNVQKHETPEIDKTIDEILTAKYIPASVVVNEEMEIVQFRGPVGLFLEPSPGKASFNLMKMARKQLAFELKNIIHKSSRTGEPEKKQGLEIKIKDIDYLVSIEVMPLQTSNQEKLFLVIFEDQPSAVAGDPKMAYSKDEVVKGLMDELNAVREDMRSIIEDQEAGKEELQSANEEIISSNEELQSINEELETSKEEVESANEELITINSELQIRNDELTETQEYAEAIFETIREAVLVLNSHMCVKMANRAFYKIFKTKPENTEGVKLHELGNGQWNSPQLRELLDKIIIHGSQFEGFEIEHDFAGAGKKIILVNGRKIIQKTHKQELVLLALEDITEHRLAQKLTEEREAWFKNIADNAPVMIWMSSADRVRNFFNTTWLTYTGRTAVQETANGWLEGVYEEDRDNYLAAYNAAFEMRKSFTAEYRLRRYDSEYRWVLDMAKPAFAADGKFTGYIGSLADVHDKKMEQEELEKKVMLRTHDLLEVNKELQRSNSELQQFAYVASHDLQEPLRKIMTFSDRLRAYDEQLPDTGKKYMEKITGSVQRMTVLIDDLLNFSRLGRSGQKFEPVDINEALKKVLTDFDVIIKEKKAAIYIDVQGIIEAIPVQMEQLFHNLVSNALKFSKDDVAPEITINSRPLSKDEMIQFAGLDEGKQYIKITVADNGIGFDSEFKEQIFVIFQRLNEMHRYPGTGIGLAICKKIVDNHCGKISASSIEGEGATFEIILPVKQK